LVWFDRRGEIAMHEDDEHTRGAGEGEAGEGDVSNSKASKGHTSKGQASERRAEETGAAKRDTAARARAPRPRIKAAPDPRMSRSLEYGVAILESFSRDHQELGIAALSDIVGISRSTTHRYATTLVALGYLEQDTKRKYRLSTRAAGPGSAAIAAVRQQVHARAVLEELRVHTRHTVSMGVLENGRVIYVYRLFAHRLGQHAIDADLGVGASVPAHCTALGKVLLASLSDAERREALAGIQLTRHGPHTITDMRALVAELDRISPRGTVVSDEEMVEGSRSIAMLVARPIGEHPLAIDVTVPSATHTVEQLVKRVAPHLERAARLISGE
jgi:IclR family transcriptional regulator, pca regulon regulatory protein